MQINIKVSASWHYRFFVEVARHVKSTRNRKRQYKSKMCVPLWCKTFNYVTVVWSCSLVLVVIYFLFTFIGILAMKLGPKVWLSRSVRLMNQYFFVLELVCYPIVPLFSMKMMMEWIPNRACSAMMLYG